MPPANPALPQQDTPAGQAARAAQIARSRTIYGWSDAVATLPANFPLTEAAYASVVNGDTLAAALAEGRLFLLDYAVFGALDPGSINI